jgi:FtsH-binding integral membrane protein
LGSGTRHARGPRNTALAASIFLDALNVFLFFLRIFSRGD